MQKKQTKKKRQNILKTVQIICAFIHTKKTIAQFKL